MSLQIKIAMGIYAAGVGAHMVWAANRGGTLSVTDYNKAAQGGRDIDFITPFEAFWSGFKWNTFWTFLDSWFWTVKFMAFIGFLLQQQYMPNRLNGPEE